MKKVTFFVFITFFFSGCLWFNERGISTRYYNDCNEYYDATGVYNKKCPKNIVDW